MNQKYFHEEFIKSLIGCKFKITNDNKNFIKFNLEFIKRELNYSMFFGVACQFNCIEEIIKLTNININDNIRTFGEYGHDILFEILYNDNIFDKTNIINKIDKLGYNFGESCSLAKYIRDTNHYIRGTNNNKIISILVEKGLDINTCYKFETALYYALKQNDYTLTDVLIDNGASPYIGNIMLQTNKKGFGHVIHKYTDDIIKVLPLSKDLIRHIIKFIYE